MYSRSVESSPMFVGGGAGYDGFGGGGLGIVALLALLGRRGFGGDGDDCCGNKIIDTSILSKLGSIEGQIGNSALETVSDLKDATQNQTLFLQNQLSQFALGVQQGFANTKDSIQGATALISSQNTDTQNLVQSVGCSIKEKISDDGEKTRALIAAINSETLNRQLTDAKNELIELRTEGRSRDFARQTEVNVSQNVNQQQAQAQAQAQFGQLLSCFHNLANELQIQRVSAANRTVQFGTGNVAIPTNTNSANQVG